MRSKKIKTLLSAFDSRVNPDEQPIPENTKSSQKKNSELRVALYRLTGVDLTAIPGIQATTVHTLLAELGRCSGSANLGHMLTDT